MKDYWALGQAPAHEKQISVAHPRYKELAKRQCRRFIRLIESQFGPPPPGAKYTVGRFSYGSVVYYQVVYAYEATDPLADSFGITLARECPTNWDTYCA